MLDINQLVREIVREELATVNGNAPDPDMISVDAACKLLDNVSKDIVLELHHNREVSNFPSVQLGPRTIKIDKRRLNAWIASGGLG